MPSERSVSVPLICPPCKLDAVLATPALPCHLLHARSSEEPVQGKDTERDGPKEGAGEEPQQIRFIGRGRSQDPNHKCDARPLAGESAQCRLLCDAKAVCSGYSCDFLAGFCLGKLPRRG